MSKKNQWEYNLWVSISLEGVNDRAEDSKVMSFNLLICDYAKSTLCILMIRNYMACSDAMIHAANPK